MFGNVTALEGLHVTGKYRDTSMTHKFSRHAAWDPHSLWVVEGGGKRREGDIRAGIKGGWDRPGQSQRAGSRCGEEELRGRKGWRQLWVVRVGGDDGELRP